MVSTAFVYIWGQRAGAVSWDSQQGLGSFEFDPQFIQKGMDLSPLKMPIEESRGRIFEFPELAKNNPTFKGLPGLLADALPDKYGNALLDAWLARMGRPAGDMNPVEKLLFIGKRSMGALEFEPSQNPTSQIATNIEISELVYMAERILSDRQEFSVNIKPTEEKALLDIIKIGTSAGGARAKALIAYNEQTGQVKSGQAQAPKGFTHWLIKFDGVQDDMLSDSQGYGRVEMAYYRMATDAGIRMMPSRLLEEHGRAHFMTQRFDRIGEKTKTHVQTLCGLAHMDFNNVHSFAYEQVFQVMRQLRLSHPQAEEMFRRMVFNVLGRNCDDHTKNFSFMLPENGHWQLAPAYDVCYSYHPESAWVSKQVLSVNGKKENIQLDDFLAVADQISLKKGKKIMEEVQQVLERWPAYAKEQKVNENLSTLIKRNLFG